MGIFSTYKTGETVTKAIADKNKDGTIPTVTLRRMTASNPEYQAKIEEFAKVYKVELNLDILTEEQAKGPLLDAFVETVLVGWEHIQRENGMEIVYSKEAAKALMLELPDLYFVLREMARNLNTFRPTEVEAGNL